MKIFSYIKIAWELLTNKEAQKLMIAVDNQIESYMKENNVSYEEARDEVMAKLQRQYMKQKIKGQVSNMSKILEDKIKNYAEEHNIEYEEARDIILKQINEERSEQ